MVGKEDDPFPLGFGNSSGLQGLCHVKPLGGIKKTMCFKKPFLNHNKPPMTKNHPTRLAAPKLPMGWSLPPLELQELKRSSSTKSIKAAFGKWSPFFVGSNGDPFRTRVFHTGLNPLVAMGSCEMPQQLLFNSSTEKLRIEPPWKPSPPMAPCPVCFEVKESSELMSLGFFCFFPGRCGTFWIKLYWFFLILFAAMEVDMEV